MKALLAALLFFVTTNALALDLYINGAKVEVDRIELWTLNVDEPRDPGQCSDPQYDFYDTNQNGEFGFGGKAYCYDPCTYPDRQPWVCDEVVSDPPPPPPTPRGGGQCANPQYDFYDTDKDGETDFGNTLCYNPCTYRGPQDLQECPL